MCICNFLMFFLCFKIFWPKIKRKRTRRMDYGDNEVV